jgi:Peptidase family M28
VIWRVNNPVTGVTVRYRALALMGLVIAAPLSAQLKPIPAPSAADRANVERIERSLAHDSMEGRGTATLGSAKAARFLASEMMKIGLKSAGDSGFFQKVPMYVPVPKPVDTSAAGRGAFTVNVGNAGNRGGNGRGGRGGPPQPPTETEPRMCMAKDGAGRTTYDIALANYPAQRARYDSTVKADSIRLASGDSSGGRGANPAGGRGAGGGRGAQAPAARPTRLPSLADLDTVPLERRRNAVNVVGMIAGGDPVLKNEIILVLSHYDHLGMRAPATPGGDSVYNGADDDAAGTTAVIEIARLLKKAGTPKRTIVFANMTGEETGLIGTNWWIAHPTFPLTQVVAGFEIEMIGRPDSLAGGPGKAWLTGYERSTMGDMLKQYGIAIVPDIRPTQSFFTRSDNIGLARRGIVAHTLSTFNLHTDYHQLSDDVDKVDFNHMTAVIHSGAEAVRHLADGPKPEWHPGCSPQTPAGGRGAGGL